MALQWRFTQLQNMQAFPSTQTRNLQRLVVLRTIEIAGQAGVMGVAIYGLGLRLPVTSLIACSSLLLLINLATAWRARQPWPVSDAELAANLFIDIVVLTAMLYFSGGSTNPFVTLYLLPLSIAAAILPPRYTWILAAATLACYSFLLFVYVPLAHETSMRLSDVLSGLPLGLNHEPAMHAGHSDFALHVIGMWLNFAASAALIAWFVSRMAQSLRDRDKQLAAAREAALRDEQLIALGLLAASAAHELGTPLATMTVLAHELARASQDPAVTRDLAVLRTQAEVCKGILMRLSAHAGPAHAMALATLPCLVFLRQVVARWQLLRPQVPLVTEFAETPVQAFITAEPSLENALLNLLNNAADASPEGVEFAANWDEAQLILEIRDRGPGVREALEQRAGSAFFTTRSASGGLGIGLFLTNASIERLGGSVTLFNRNGGGACVRVTLALKGASA